MGGLEVPALIDVCEYSRAGIPVIVRAKNTIGRVCFSASLLLLAVYPGFLNEDDVCAFLICHTKGNVMMCLSVCYICLEDV